MPCCGWQTGDSESEAGDRASPLSKLLFNGTCLQKAYREVPSLLGITGQAVSTIVRRFVCIRNFIELLEQEKILAIHATVVEVKKYADGLRERGIQAKGFNERIFGIGHFYKFMEVKQYITRMPFRIEY